MTDEQTEPEIEQPEGEQHSRIIVEFERPGDADPQNIYLEAVTIGQVQIAAERLRMMAERQLEHKWQMAKMKQAQEQAQMAQMKAMLAGEKVA